MVDVVNNVKTVFSTVDQTSGPLGAMARSAGRVSGMFDRASSIVGMFGSAAGAAAGAFSVGKAIAGTMSFLESVKKVQQYTGMAAEDAGGMMDVMEGVGIEGEEAVRLMSRMAMSSSRMQMGMAGYGRSLGGAVNLYRQLGLAGKKPEQQLFQMAKLAKDHRLSIQQVQQVYRVAPESARKLLSALEKGPDALRKQMAEMKKLGIATESNVAMVSRIKQSQRDIKDAWNKIQMVLGAQLLPIVEKFLNTVKERLPEWIALAQKFGKVLADILDKHGSKLLFIGKLMMANFAVMKVTGHGMGGLLKMAPMAGAKMMSMLGGGAAAATGGAGAAGAAGIGAAISAALPLILAIAAVAAVIYVMVKAWKANVAGVQEVVKNAWARIRVHLGSLAATFAKLFGPLARLFSSSGAVGKFFLVYMASVMKFWMTGIERFLFYLRVAIKYVELLFESLSEVFNGIWDSFKKIASYVWDAFMSVIRAIGDGVMKIFEMVRNIPGLGDAMTTAIDYWKKTMLGTSKDQDGILSGTLAMWKKAKGLVMAETEMALAAQRVADRREKAEKPPEDRQQYVNDFRNSRFDITQKFAEGFDPDRIAVAFSTDLATLAERRLQSGLSPLYSVT